MSKSYGEKCESVCIFSNVSELVASFERTKKLYNPDSEWCGGSIESVFDYLKNGDIESVAAASSIADRLNDSVDAAGVRSEWSPDVVGSFANVPAFLAGDPCSMWARSPVQDERGEISVYINTAVSCDCSAEDMRRRGVCVLALILALQRVRSVRAFVYASCGVCCPCLRLSYPLDISELCAAVTKPQITRRAFYGAARARGWESKWADWAAPIAGDHVERAAVRRLFNVEGSALVLTPDRLGAYAGLSDGDFINRLNGLVAAVNDGVDNL